MSTLKDFAFFRKIWITSTLFLPDKLEDSKLHYRLLHPCSTCTHSTTRECHVSITTMVNTFLDLPKMFDTKQPHILSMIGPRLLCRRITALPQDPFFNLWFSIIVRTHTSYALVHSGLNRSSGVIVTKTMVVTGNQRDALLLLLMLTQMYRLEGPSENLWSASNLRIWDTGILRVVQMCLTTTNNCQEESFVFLSNFMSGVFTRSPKDTANARYWTILIQLWSM